MNKFLRIISTLVVGVGLILLFVYLSFQNNVDKSLILNQPSYYTLQNYWYLLVAGCGCVAFSIISCFLAWNKKMDEKVEILPNAVAAEKTELLGWLSGSSLDTDKRYMHKTPSTEKRERHPGKTARKYDEEPATQTPRKTESDTADSTMATGGKARHKARIVEEYTLLEDISPMTEVDINDTVLSEDPETVMDDGITVIERK